jgi:hypothetical protein
MLTTSFNSGVSIEAVRRRLGYASTETTQLYALRMTRSPTPRSAPPAGAVTGQHAVRSSEADLRLTGLIEDAAAVASYARLGLSTSSATPACKTACRQESAPGQKVPARPAQRAETH